MNRSILAWLVGGAVLLHILDGHAWGRPPELAPIPETLEWTVQITTNSPEMDVARTVPDGVVQQSVSRSGRYRRIIEKSYDGLVSESWVMGEWMIWRKPGWPAGRYVPERVDSSMAPAYAKDIPEVVEAMKDASYKGEERYNGKKAHLYQKESPKVSVWIDASNSLPLAVVAETYTRTYTFSPRKESTLKPPQEIVEKAKLFNEKLETNIVY